MTTSDFAVLARDLPSLVAPLHPFAEQWEPLGHFPVYQVMIRGRTKVEYLFLEQFQRPTPPLNPGKDTLGAINTHFWDWIWWLATEEAAGVPISSRSTCLSSTDIYRCDSTIDAATPFSTRRWEL